MKGLKGILGTVRELFSFLWQNKLWWLSPIVVVLLLFGSLLVLGSTTGLGPFVYSLF